MWQFNKINNVEAKDQIEVEISFTWYFFFLKGDECHFLRPLLLLIILYFFLLTKKTISHNKQRCSVMKKFMTFADVLFWVSLGGFLLSWNWEKCFLSVEMSLLILMAMLFNFTGTSTDKILSHCLRVAKLSLHFLYSLLSRSFARNGETSSALKWV